MTGRVMHELLGMKSIRGTVYENMLGNMFHTLSDVYVSTSRRSLRGINLSQCNVGVLTTGEALSSLPPALPRVDGHTVSNSPVNFKGPLYLNVLLGVPEVLNKKHESEGKPLYKSLAFAFPENDDAPTSCAALINTRYARAPGHSQRNLLDGYKLREL